VKRLTKIEDIPYLIEIRPTATIRTRSWDRALVLVAPTVGSDGYLRDGETHTVEFGELKVTRRSITVRWSYGSVLRPDEDPRYDDKRVEPKGWEMREVVLPKNSNAASSQRRLSHIRDRIVKLVAPQHSWMFGNREALDLCQRVHHLVLAQDIMES